MPDPLLATKVSLPLLRHPYVPRREVLQRLSTGLSEDHLLTLVSAPAGYGKTTTLRLWVEELNRPVAWVRLDKNDNDLSQFLKYVLTALQRIVDSLGQTALEMVDAAPDVNVSLVASLVINDLIALPQPIILVLEDYHLIENQEVDALIASLLSQAIHNLHLVITTREDPALSLAHLRVRNQLTEIRAADLRFSLDEAIEFFTKVMSIHLPEKQVDILDQRTEGWVAGLQLAALSLKHSQNPEAFVSAFRGTHRHVLDYLLEEVLNSQPEEVCRFLRRTSILEQLSSSLCQAVTGQNNSHQLLRYLDQRNLFLVPLDDHRIWYRYHALFAELLRNQLSQTEPDRCDELHARAASWYSENGYVHEAIEHAFQVSDRALVLRLLEAHAIPMFFRGEVTTVAAWFDRLPEPYLRTSPMLCISKAWSLALMQRDPRRGEVNRALQQAKEALEKAGADDALRNMVGGHTATIQGFLMQYPVLVGETPKRLLEISQMAQSLLPKEARAFRCVNSMNMGYAYMALVDLPASMAAFEETLKDGLAAGNLYAAIYGPIGLILIAILEGRNGEALQVCETNLRLFKSLVSGQRFPPIGALYVQKGSLLLEQDRIADAEEAVSQGLDLVRWTGEKEAHLKGFATRARLCAIRRDWSGMLDSLKALEAAWPEGAMYARAFRHRLSLHYLADADRDVEDALTWLAQLGIAFDNLPDIDGVDPVSEMKFQTYLCVGHVLARLAKRTPTPDSYRDAHHYFERQQAFARNHGLVRWLVELAIVRARLYQATGDMNSAYAMVQEGLHVASQKGFFRIFVDEGAPMLALLEGVRPHLTPVSLVSYAERLLDAIKRERSAPPTVDVIGVGPLSERELDVLRCLAAGLTYPGIAERLIISVNTVRFHVKGMYSKLGVSDRAAAIALAREQQLI